MKNLTIKVPFNEGQYDILRYFLEQKDVFLEDEVEQFLMSLYRRTVPKNLQPYYDDMAAKASNPARPRPAKAKDG